MHFCISTFRFMQTNQCIYRKKKLMFEAYTVLSFDEDSLSFNSSVYYIT